MKFKVNRDHLANGLAQVLNVVGTKAAMPILSNVLIDARDGMLSLTTTNLDLGIRAKIKAEVKVAGVITLPVKRFANIVKELPHPEVYIEANANHQVKITSGTSTFKIMGIAEDEFPPLPEFIESASVTLEQGQLATMVESVAYSQSTDESRFILNGVFCNFQNDKLTLVATDGRRLALISRDVTLPVEAIGSIILPAKTILELARLLTKGDNLRVSYTARRATFELDVNKDTSGLVGKLFLCSKVVEGNYPNYVQVIPAVTHHRIQLDRMSLLECVHRASLVCSEKSNTIVLKFSTNLLEITAQSSDFGEAHETLVIPYTGPEVQVAFNPFFVLDPLNALTSDNVFLEIKDGASPGVFKTLDSFLCVIMPVRVG